LLRNYITPQLPSPPVSCDWTKGITQFGVLDNDVLGCCTISGIAHSLQVFSANVGDEIAVTDAEVLQYYEAWCGYNPSEPSTDQGGIELDVLNSWKQQEFAGHALIAYADVDHGDIDQVKRAIWLFGGLYIGVSLPSSAQSQVGSVWDVAPNPEGKPGNWGGHCVFVTGYDADGLTCITWGKLQKMTWGFWNEYVDEAHALLSQDFIAANGLDPSGFDLAALQADLADIR
jgi:hypothetical protein